MNKTLLSLTALLLISLHCLSINARDDRVNFSVFAPGYAQHHNQAAPKFVSVFTHHNDHVCSMVQKSQTSKILQANQQSQQTTPLGYFGSWRKQRADAKREAIVRKSLAVIAASQRKPILSRSHLRHQTPPYSSSKKSNIIQETLQKEITKHHARLHNHNQVYCDGQDHSFQQVMHKRSQALTQSLGNPTLTKHDIKMNAQTQAFLQMYGIDPMQFQQVEGLPIQDHLSHELVDVLHAVADYAERHHAINQTHLTKYCAHLASVSQQSNMQGALEQAIDGTNCCHGIEHYLQGIVSGVAQAYQQFQTALNYFDTVTDTYGNLIVQHAAQGAMVAHGLETIVTAGIIAAPTATIAATGIMIGATAYVMAPVCAQAMIDTVAFGGACIRGDWDKIGSDLDNFGKFISSRETVGRMAEFAGGAVMPTPNLNCVVEQVMSLRPVITSIQNTSGEKVQSFYLMTKNQLQKVCTQGLELLRLPEFAKFNMKCKKAWGSYFFDILPRSHPALAGAFSGLETGIMSSAEQAVLAQLLTRAETSIVGDIVKSPASSIASQTAQAIEQKTKSLIAEQVNSVASLHKIVQQEIAQVAQQPILSIDLTAKITDAKYAELRELSSQIRQLQDLAKYTDNFKNVENLIPEDICYLNRVHELQLYRAQIKNLLDTHKPYFMHDGQAYFIEDIASYHIHAGDYYRKDAPKGGHSNYDGHKLVYFNPQIIENGLFGTKDAIFYNSRNANLTKKSTIYPETWSEFVSDLKAIEVMTSDKAIIKISQDQKSLEIIGFTAEGLKIRIYYDIAKKRIKTHHPFCKET